MVKRTQSCHQARLLCAVSCDPTRHPPPLAHPQASARAMLKIMTFESLGGQQPRPLGALDFPEGSPLKFRSTSEAESEASTSEASSEDLVPALEAEAAPERAGEEPSGKKKPKGLAGMLSIFTKGRKKKKGQPSPAEQEGRPQAPPGRPPTGRGAARGWGPGQSLPGLAEGPARAPGRRERGQDDGLGGVRPPGVHLRAHLLGRLGGGGPGVSPVGGRRPARPGASLRLLGSQPPLQRTPRGCVRGGGRPRPLARGWRAHAVSAPQWRS